MAEAFETISSRDCSFDLQPSVAGNPSRNLGKGYTPLHPDNDPLGQCDWHALREIAPLPVLFLDCLGHTSTSLACRLPPNLAICFLGCAGVCVERLPEH